MYLEVNSIFNTLNNLLIDMLQHEDTKTLSSYLNKLDLIINDIRKRFYNINNFTNGLHEYVVTDENIKRLYLQGVVRNSLLYDFTIAITEKPEDDELRLKVLDSLSNHILLLFGFIQENYPSYASNINFYSLFFSDERVADEKAKQQA